MIFFYCQNGFIELLMKIKKRIHYCSQNSWENTDIREFSALLIMIVELLYLKFNNFCLNPSFICKNEWNGSNFLLKIWLKLSLSIITLWKISLSFFKSWNVIFKCFYLVFGFEFLHFLWISSNFEYVSL
jgi:hypothetical protein